jgi:hypothetical protein
MIDTAAQTCRDRVDRIGKILDEAQALLDELVAPCGKQDEGKDTDCVIAALEYRLEVLESKAGYLLAQMKSLSLRL